MAALIDFDRNHVGRIGNQHTGIIEYDGTKFLYSYSLCIGIVDAEGNATYREGSTVTTNRHLRQFARVFGPGTTVATAHEFEAVAAKFGGLPGGSFK